MKATVYQEPDLTAKYGKGLTPITESDINMMTFDCGWVFVKHTSGHILKCEATQDKKWRILGTNSGFSMESGQLVLSIKKPAPKKVW